MTSPSLEPLSHTDIVLDAWRMFLFFLFHFLNDLCFTFEWSSQPGGRCNTGYCALEGAPPRPSLPQYLLLAHLNPCCMFSPPLPHQCVGFLWGTCATCFRRQFVHIRVSAWGFWTHTGAMLRSAGLISELQLFLNHVFIFFSICGKQEK